ncbi:hypothetical protein JL107_18425 [Nakamurella flavida]|uniref:Uncharacterized protein n=1 Tax=Nakamurella flavida TaxID=363630 RepID=A0A938YDY1_9ACTN|nr:hypothetical protein [Nakamurella flavida]MBM9475910.1 hypothetical protein [Nakamurella flavida]MBM9478430.1 hypothetical protein [Nakamurella flavida]MDP9777804.1 glutathione S-transferase [Nakamurella flavida]
MTDARAGSGGLFDSPAVTEYLAALRDSPALGAGELMGAALRAVAQGSGVLTADDARRGLATVALLLAERTPAVLDDAPDPESLRTWLADLDTELTPARRQASEAVLRRVALPLDNAWFTDTGQDPTGPTPAVVSRMQDLLADAAG